MGRFGSAPVAGVALLCAVQESLLEHSASLCRSIGSVVRRFMDMQMRLLRLDQGPGIALASIPTAASSQPDLAELRWLVMLPVRP